MDYNSSIEYNSSTGVLLSYPSFNELQYFQEVLKGSIERRFWFLINCINTGTRYSTASICFNTTCLRPSNRWVDKHAAWYMYAHETCYSSACYDTSTGLEPWFYYVTAQAETKNFAAASWTVEIRLSTSSISRVVGSRLFTYQLRYASLRALICIKPIPIHVGVWWWSNNVLFSGGIGLRSAREQAQKTQLVQPLHELFPIQLVWDVP